MEKILNYKKLCEVVGEPVRTNRKDQLKHLQKTFDIERVGKKGYKITGFKLGHILSRCSYEFITPNLVVRLALGRELTGLKYVFIKENLKKAAAKALRKTQMVKVFVACVKSTGSGKERFQILEAPNWKEITKEFCRWGNRLNEAQAIYAYNQLVCHGKIGSDEYVHHTFRAYLNNGFYSTW